MLVGDSMNRNQFESLLCLLHEGLADKSRMYEIHGYKITKGRGYYVFKFLVIQTLNSWALIYFDFLNLCLIKTLGLEFTSLMKCLLFSKAWHLGVIMIRIVVGRLLLRSSDFLNKAKVVCSVLPEFLLYLGQNFLKCK